MRHAIWMLMLLTVLGQPLAANECLGPKNALSAPVVCGRVIDPIGESVANFALQLINKDKVVVGTVHSDRDGNFMFGATAKGDYNLTTTDENWRLFWPITVTSSKPASTCKRPMVVKLSLACAGSVARKGYHIKWGQ